MTGRRSNQLSYYPFAKRERRHKSYGFVVACQVVFGNIFANGLTVFRFGLPESLILVLPCPPKVRSTVLGSNFRPDMNEPNFVEKLRENARKVWEFKTGPLFLALFLQGLLLVGTGFVVVFAPRFSSDPEFVAKKTIYLPQRELEHRVALAELRQLSTPPAMISKLATSALLPDSLPDMPALAAMASMSRRLPP